MGVQPSSHIGVDIEVPEPYGVMVPTCFALPLLVLAFKTVPLFYAL